MIGAVEALCFFQKRFLNRNCHDNRRKLRAMHEMSLAEGVLQLIEDAAREQKFEKVTAVWLDIGQLSGAEVEAMKFCFDAVIHDTLANGARLEINVTPGTGWCDACLATVFMREVFDACPQCGHHPLQVTGGTEMRVKELEVA